MVMAIHGINGPWTILIVMQSNGVQTIATWQPHKHKIRKELKDSTSTLNFEQYRCRSSPYLPFPHRKGGLF